MRDSGNAKTKKVWERSAKRSRAEEMEEARKLLQQPEVESISKSVIVQSFGHNDRINTEFVVLEILTAEGEIKLVRAYVVESITQMDEVNIPEVLRDQFARRQDWPR